MSEKFVKLRKNISVVTLTIGLLLILVYPAFQSVVAKSGGSLVSCIKLDAHLNVAIAAIVVILGSFVMLYSCTGEQEMQGT